MDSGLSCGALATREGVAVERVMATLGPVFAGHLRDGGLVFEACFLACGIGADVVGGSPGGLIRRGSGRGPCCRAWFR